MGSRRIIGHENAVEALAALCNDYRISALRAVRDGRESVFIPASTEDPRAMLELLEHPDGLLQQAGELVLASSNQRKEPVYSTLADGQRGRNADGTPHAGFFEVDVVAKKVVGYVNRDGESLVPRLRPCSGEALANELMGRPNSYCF